LARCNSSIGSPAHGLGRSHLLFFVSDTPPNIRSRFPWRIQARFYSPSGSKSDALE
jgi:hypothetical protein